MCDTEDGKMLYNAATTDLVPYSIRSKSNVAQSDGIDGFLNMILSVSGFNFEEVNESILGRPIVDNGKTDKEKEESEKEDTEDDDGSVKSNSNSTAERVNPFDRFGMAGLKWSSYSGEWKYYETDGCADQEESSTTDFGVFYKDRKEPKASFNESSESKDPRVIQYNKGVFASWGNAFNGLITNGLFSITKGIVTFTIALISFSLTDVTDIIGLGSSNGTDGLVGLFTNLYNGFFTPLVTLAFLFTAVYVMYYGLVKRQLRQALISGLAQTIICLFLAVVIASNASFWIPLPNRVATYGQAIIINAMGQSTDGQNGLCGTNVGAMKKPSVNINGSLDQQQAQMEAIGSNMRSTIGCRMWEEFLLKPWTRGQFGAEYSDLTVAGSKGGKLKNINSEWTKKADVPLGGNVIEHNLALFQISSQTEAHAQLSPETGLATDSNDNRIRKVDGISSDWWRIADILSNYDEEMVTTTPPGSTTSVETEERVNSNPLPQWQSWVGNKPSERYSIAFLSIIFGGIGSVGPLVFGLLATIYSVGVTLLMAISPIFLLLGCWAGRGQQALKGWLEALISTMIKKLVATGLLLISFAFTINAMNMINTIGWMKAFLLLFIMTLVLIKNRKLIMDTFAKINLGGALRPDQMFSNFTREKSKHVDDAAMMGTAAITGAQQARKLGMSMAEGAALGAGVQAKNIMRKSTFGRAALVESNRTSNSSKFCVMCSQRIDPTGASNKTYHYYINDEGDYICPDCALDLGLETELYKVEGRTSDSQKINKRTRKSMRKIAKQRVITRGLTKEEGDEYVKNNTSVLRDSEHAATSNSSWLSYTKAQEMMNLSRDEEGNVYWDNDGVVSMISDNLTRLDSSIDEYEEAWRKHGEAANPPAVPEPISKYVSSAYLDEAWHAGHYDLIKHEYTEAWKNWYIDNSISITNLDSTDREATIDYIGNIPIDVVKVNDNSEGNESDDGYGLVLKPNTTDEPNISVAQSIREEIIQSPVLNKEYVDKVMEVKVTSDGDKEWNDSNVVSMISDNLDSLDKTLALNELSLETEEKELPISTPEPIEEYVDQKHLAEALDSRNLEEVKDLHAKAWTDWYDDNSSEMVNVPIEVKKETMNAISNESKRVFTKEMLVEKTEVNDSKLDPVEPVDQLDEEPLVITPEPKVTNRPFRKGEVDAESKRNRKTNKLTKDKSIKGDSPAPAPDSSPKDDEQVMPTDNSLNEDSRKDDFRKNFRKLRDNDK